MTDINPYEAPQAPVHDQEATGKTAPVAEARRVKAGRGAAWYGDGLAIVAAAPAAWLLSFLLVVAIYLISAVPAFFPQLIGSVAGSVVSSLVAIPMMVFSGGVMAACHSQTFTFARVVAAMRERGVALTILGVLYMVVFLIIALLVMLTLFFFSGQNLLTAGATIAEAQVVVNLVLIGVLLGIVLAVPLLMAMWFAPALVAVGHRSPARAMIESFRASLKNLLAFIVFFFVGILAAIAILILVGIVFGILGGVLGLVASGSNSLSWLIFIPIGIVYLGFSFLGFAVFFGTQYASFSDIFVARR